jgi:outer membrane protein TolC
VLALSGGPWARAAEPIVPAQAAAAPALLDLQQCLQLSQQRHPRIAATRASQAAAQSGQQALESLKVPTVLEPELPIRRRQAAVGQTAAEARVEAARWQEAYAVTRLYYEVLYAREQERVAGQIVRRLANVQTLIQKAVASGASRTLTENDVNNALAYLRLAEVKQIQARAGVRRALAALREALGVGPAFCFDIVGRPFVAPDRQPCKGEVIAWAVARNPAGVLAGVFAKVAALEVDAQASTCRRRVETFAAGTDVHGRKVPPGQQGKTYRPGAVSPEMPTMLVGQKHDRVQTAQDLAARAASVVEETLHLIALEAEDAFLRWEEARDKAAKAREAADAGRKLAESLQKQLAAGSNVKPSEVITARVVTAQAQGQLNEYTFDEILALLDMEWVTAGAFHSGLTAPPSAAAPAPAAHPPGDAKK